MMTNIQKSKEFVKRYIVKILLFIVFIASIISLISQLIGEVGIEQYQDIHQVKKILNKSEKMLILNPDNYNYEYEYTLYLDKKVVDILSEEIETSLLDNKITVYEFVCIKGVIKKLLRKQIELHEKQIELKIELENNRYKEKLISDMKKED